MHRSLLASAASLAILSASPAMAAGFILDEPRSTTLDMLGSITAGDADRFEAALTDAANKGITVRTVALDSSGGRIDEALKLAAVVSSQGLATTTMRDQVCASACVLILASGTSVHVVPGSHVGVHQGRNGDGTVAWGASYQMAQYLSERHVAHHVVEQLLAKEGSDCDWLSDDDVAASGWTLAGVPAVVPVSLPTAPPSPPAMLPVALPRTRDAFTCQPTINGRPDGPVSHLLWKELGTGNETRFRLAEAVPVADPNVVKGRMRAPCVVVDGSGQQTVFAGEEVAGSFQVSTPGTEQVKAVAPRPLDISPEVSEIMNDDIVEVPRRDVPATAPAVIPAPSAAPQVAVEPPPVFRPIPAPADEAFNDVAARCRITFKSDAPKEADCTVGRAADGSVRVHIAGDKAPVYLYPTGPDSYLPSFDGRSFALSMPLAVSPDRMCVTMPDFQGCAWTMHRPTVLDGINGLVASLFGAAVNTERRLGLLGE